jgi:hypothetical protein
MNELLASIVEAHGGLDRWHRFNCARATIVTGGAFWGMKSLTQNQDLRRMTVSLHEGRASVAPFGDPDCHTEFTPDRIANLRGGDTVVAERHDPHTSFAGHEMTTPWDPLHRAYFNGYALWTHLTTASLLPMAGVQVTEGEPWAEGRETWRVLPARFPASIATNNAIQDFFFGGDLVLRRHDYNVDVAGVFAEAQLECDYVEADSVGLPSRRRAQARGTDSRPRLDPLMVSPSTSATPDSPDASIGVFCPRSMPPHTLTAQMAKSSVDCPGSSGWACR